MLFSEFQLLVACGMLGVFYGFSAYATKKVDKIYYWLAIALFATIIISISLRLIRGDFHAN
jgi:hypothetical protein